MAIESNLGWVFTSITEDAIQCIYIDLEDNKLCASGDPWDVIDLSTDQSIGSITGTGDFIYLSSLNTEHSYNISSPVGASGSAQLSYQSKRIGRWQISNTEEDLLYIDQNTNRILYKNTVSNLGIEIYESSTDTITNISLWSNINGINLDFFDKNKSYQITVVNENPCTLNFVDGDTSEINKSILNLSKSFIITSILNNTDGWTQPVDNVSLFRNNQSVYSFSAGIEELQAGIDLSTDPNTEYDGVYFVRVVFDKNDGSQIIIESNRISKTIPITEINNKTKLQNINKVLDNMITMVNDTTDRVENLEISGGDPWEIKNGSLPQSTINAILEKEPNIKAENIVSGINIFGIDGSFDTSANGLTTAEIEAIEDGIVTRTIDKISYDGITTIPNYAFYNCSNLSKAIFKNVENIGSSAFYSCTKLNTIIFPNCTTIGDNAFQYCSTLREVTFPLCTSLGSGVFAYCDILKEVTFPMCTYINASMRIYFF